MGGVLVAVELRTLQPLLPALLNVSLLRQESAALEKWLAFFPERFEVLHDIVHISLPSQFQRPKPTLCRHRPIRTALVSPDILSAKKLNIDHRTLIFNIELVHLDRPWLKC